MTKKFNHTLWFQIVVFSISTVFAQIDGTKLKKIDNLFARYGSESPGVSIRVIKDGVIVHSKEYGLANLEHDIPITKSTLFFIGSLSKQFTGMAIAMLAEQGKIDLDEDVRKYVSDLPDFGAIITIRHLLHHQSGLRDWVRPFSIAGWHAGDVIDFDEVMEFLRRQKELNFKPGEKYMYSNTGYVLLAEVIQSVTETPFPRWMKENIFEPLNMKSALVRKNYYDFVKDLADSYFPMGKKKYGPVRSGLTAYGSCCIATTIDDLVKWVLNFEKAKVGGTKVIHQMIEDKIKINAWDGRLVGYGYGLMHFEYHGYHGIFHSGQWVGYRAAILYVPEEHFAVVALGNAGPSVNLREWNILDIILGNRTIPAKHKQILKTSTIPILIDSLILKEYTGTYNLWMGEILTVKRDTIGIKAEFLSEPGFYHLNAVSKTIFQFHTGGDTVRFEPGNLGKTTGLYWRNDYAPKVERFNPTTDELQNFTGTFYSEEIESTMRFIIKDNKLMARHIRWGENLQFTPTIQDEFRGKRLILQARFARDTHNRITEVFLTGRRAHNLRFVKLKSLLGPSQQ